jgi:hypothetical protein
MTTANTSCGVPQNVTLGNVTSSSAQLSWNVVAGASYYRITLSNGVTTSTYSSSSLSYQINNLIANTNYTYSVAAVCGNIPGSSSAVATFSTPAVVCSTVTGTTVTNITFNSARISWTASTSANSYKVEYQEQGATTFLSYYSQGTTVIVSNLKPNTVYNYKITPTCAGVVGTPSALSSFTTIAPPVCNPPSNVTANNVTNTGASLSWTANAGSSLYRIFLTKQGATAASVYSTSNTFYNFGGLTPNTTYTYSVASVCSGFVGASSTPATFTTSAASNCVAPAGFTASNVTAYGANFSWTAVQGVTLYRLSRVVSGSTVTPVLASTSATTFTTTSLSPSTTYIYTISSVCAGVTGPVSAAITVTTSAAPACNPPTNVTVSNIDVQKATVSWTPASGATYYRITMQPSNTTVTSTYTVSSTASLYNFTTLSPNTTYTYRVASACGNINNLSPFSAPQTFTTLPAGVCGAPTNVTVTNIGSFGARVSWDSIPNVTYWKVQVIPTGTASTSFFTSYKKSYIVSNLTPNTNYTANVTAVCASNVSSGTTSTTFSTTVATVCPDLNEPNDVTTAATPLTVGVAASGAIDVITDSDFFSFSNTATEPHLKVTLTNLPKDYDLKLFNAAGVQVGYSLAGGTNNEVIKIANAPVGTYYAKVFGFGSTGFTPYACYSIKAEIAAIPFTFAPNGNGGSKAIATSTENNILAFDVFPNPVRDEATVNFNEHVNGAMQVNIMDITGRIVKHYDWNVSAAETRFNVDLSELQNGLYLMTCNNGVQQKTAKIVVNK